MVNDIKFPRVMVSKTRHAKLLKESRRRAKAGESRATIQDVAEEQFKSAESK